MNPKRIEIIPSIHGKLTRDGKLSEPDIYYILDKWLERHPAVKKRERDIRISRGLWTLPEGIRTEVVNVLVVEGEDIAGYDPTSDRDLYEYYLMEEHPNRPAPEFLALKSLGERLRREYDRHYGDK